MQRCESPTRIGMGCPLRVGISPWLSKASWSRGSAKGFPWNGSYPPNALVPDCPQDIHRSLPWVLPLKCILLLEPPPPPTSTSSQGPQKNSFLWSLLLPSGLSVISIFWAGLQAERPLPHFSVREKLHILQSSGAALGTAVWMGNAPIGLGTT